MNQLLGSRSVRKYDTSDFALLRHFIGCSQQQVLIEGLKKARSSRNLEEIECREGTIVRIVDYIEEINPGLRDTDELRRDDAVVYLHYSCSDPTAEVYVLANNLQGSAFVYWVEPENPYGAEFRLIKIGDLLREGPICDLDEPMVRPAELDFNFEPKTLAEIRAKYRSQPAEVAEKEILP